jgi:UDPglucose 6-dehydrogenase
MAPMGSKIAVIGTGYVGLTTGACLAHLGHDVVCADIDADKVDRLSRGEIPILEAGLDEIVREGLQSGRLQFILGAANAVADAEFVYLCVPTPQGSDGSADLSYIETAAKQIAAHLAPETVVINKSTVPVGSTRFVELALGRSDVYVISNPEFLREGSAVNDFLHPDRVIIGSDDQSAAIRVASLYIGVPAPLMVTDPASAETIKYASNAFLATKLSFVNAVAALCEAVGADVNDVVLGMGYDKRIGHEFLRPGPGWGGSCFLPEETLLRRRGDDVRLMSFEQLAVEIERSGADRVEVLSWKFGDPRPEFFPISAFTVRQYEGTVVEVRTKMGRRIRVTEDHPFVVGDGRDPESFDILEARDLTEQCWLPIAQDAPLPVVDAPTTASLLDGIPHAGLEPHQVIIRLTDEQLRYVEARSSEIDSTRRRDVLRCRAMKLSELTALAIDPEGSTVSSVTNGTYVPTRVELDERFWRVLGLYLAEGHIGIDGQRVRTCWSFHREDEQDLVDAVVDYWRGVGVEPRTYKQATTHQVSISSRVLGGWLKGVLEVGHDCYTKRLPDVIWSASPANKRALLRGLWDGDGSWSLVAGGPSVVLEYGTVSRELADGMVRLLGDLGIVARLKVGRANKSTTDTYWLTISGADQVEEALFLVPDDEASTIRTSIGQQAKRINPTGYRRLGKGAVWARVTHAEPTPYRGPVYSVEVPAAGTVVATHGLIAHNCFPKDSRALLYIANEAGYHFDMLEGVISVNQEQFDRVAAKIEAMAGGALDGKKVAVWGLTFKANTDDRRESPSLEIVSRLLAKGAQVQGYDPTVTADVEGYESMTVVADPYAACDGADVLAVLTEWDEFKWLDLDKVADVMAERRVVDARNLLDRTALVRRGFTYEGIGRS